MPELLELVLESTISNQTFINRWYYIMNGTPAVVSPTFGLMNAFGLIFSGTSVPNGSVFDEIISIQTPSLKYTQAIAKNPYDVTDFYDRPFVGGLPGIRPSPGDDMPAYVAVGFRTSRVRTDIRRATKRFGGLGETVNVTGGNIDSSYASNLAAIAAVMADVLEYDDEGNTLTFTPCVVKKEKYTVPGTDPARYAYRYMADKDDQLALTATGFTWEPYSTLRSQVSRQIGRGQ
jgi:hypothetical protein